MRCSVVQDYLFTVVGSRTQVASHSHDRHHGVPSTNLSFISSCTSARSHPRRYACHDFNSSKPKSSFYESSHLAAFRSSSSLCSVTSASVTFLHATPIVDSRLSRQFHNFTPHNMCQEVEERFTDCPHVSDDVRTIPCDDNMAGRPCNATRTGSAKIIWLERREPGKCSWCLQEDKDRKAEKDRKKRIQRT